jgi:hypothetical protein
MDMLVPSPHPNGTGRGVFHALAQRKLPRARGTQARREVPICVPSRGNMGSVTVAREHVYCMVSPNPIATLDDCVSKMNPFSQTLNPGL